MTPESRYSTYADFCRKLGQEPLDFERWLRLSEWLVRDLGGQTIVNANRMPGDNVLC